MAMQQRLDAMLAQCECDIKQIATIEAEISASSNRLHAELGSIGQNSMSAGTQQLYKKNTETLLKTLIAYTSSSPSNAQVTSLAATLPAYKIPPSNKPDEKSPTHPSSVINLQTRVHNKCRQIRHNGTAVNIINETIQQELGL